LAKSSRGAVMIEHWADRARRYAVLVRIGVVLSRPVMDLVVSICSILFPRALKHTTGVRQKP